MTGVVVGLRLGSGARMPGSMPASGRIKPVLGAGDSLRIGMVPGLRSADGAQAAASSGRQRIIQQRMASQRRRTGSGSSACRTGMEG